MGRYLYNNQEKRNIPIRVAAVLFCLTLFSIYLVTGLFARYATSAESDDGARVARFSIQGEGALSEGFEAGLIPGGSEPVVLQIQNNSEVAVEYTIEVANVTKNLPLSISMEKDGTPVGSVDESGVIKLSDQQIPGSHTDSYSLIINWAKSANADDDLSQTGMVDYIAVTVTATQID